MSAPAPEIKNPEHPRAAVVVLRPMDHVEPETSDARAVPSKDLEAKSREAAHSDTAETADPSASGVKKPKRLRQIILGVLLVGAVVYAAPIAYDWWQVGRFLVTTDDAYVRADISQLGARVSGYVAGLPLAENAPVKAGQTVVQLDDTDYKIAVASAEAKIATQKSLIAVMAKQVAAQDMQIAMAEARLTAAQAAQTNAAQTRDRIARLVAQKYESQQRQEDLTATVLKAQAGVTEAQAAVNAERSQAEVLKAQQLQSEIQLDEFQTSRTQVLHNLSLTAIKAPFDGIIGKRAVQVGQYVQAGQRLMALVPMSRYVEANFKETQLANIRIGQPATVAIDALGDETLKGVVSSIAPASGAEFSVLPPENATGNFTKITQRIPVRITLPVEQAAHLPLGLSAVVSLDERDGAKK